jgi:heptosyltransferase-2
MKIGVWNTAFLGDAVLTLPLLRALARNYPGAKLDFWVRAGLAPLFRAQPELAAVHEVAKRGNDKGLSGMLRIAMEVRSQRYDLWISCHRSFRSGIAALLSGAKRRVGYSSPWMNRLFYTVTVPRGFGEEDEIERLLRLAPPGEYDPWPELALGSEAKVAADRFWSGLDNRPVLALHPGSTWPTKRWPSAGFSRVAGMAVEAGARVLLLGGPGEGVLTSEILEGVESSQRDRVVDLAEKLDLPTLAAYIARSDCYLGNDAGPLHLAWTQRVPVVALFGPTVRAHGFFPRGPRALVLERELACRPCGLHGGLRCPEGRHACMTGVTPEDVWSAVRPRLGL